MKEEHPQVIKDIFQVITLLLAMYLFILSIKMMGTSFKNINIGLVDDLLITAQNPFMALFIGIFATSLIQSSSTITSMLVGLVSSGAMTVSTAVPIVMGANIGTSVTNTIVSFAHVTRKEEFKKAFAGATVHDFFNFMAVGLLFPLELATGFSEHAAHAVAVRMVDSRAAALANPISAITKPVIKHIHEYLSYEWMLLLSLVVLFIALKLIVSMIKELILNRFTSFINEFLFKNDATSFSLGLVLTGVVQSSSVTTSLVVPLIGAGVVTIYQVFPYMLGANIGTCFTAVISSLVAEEHKLAAMTIAFEHLFFNSAGVLLLYPIKRIRHIPITISTRLAEVATRSKKVAILYVLGMFYGLPILLILLSKLF